MKAQAKKNISAQHRRLAATGCILAGLALPAFAADNLPADGSLGRMLFGDDFGAASNTRLGGWLEIGAVLKDGKGQPQGLGNSPVVLARDRGLQLNQLYVYLERDIRSNIIPRATPIPAPVFTDYSFGYHLDFLYGRDGQPIQTFGWDDKWSVNKPGNADPGKAAADRQGFLVMPQAYLQAYLPWGMGTTVMAGNFMSPIGNEIGFHPQPGPNIFYTHSYSFTAAPIKHSGVLADTYLMKNDDSGLLAAEFGVVNGWSNFKDNNKRLAYIGALRYRTLGMDTWVDYEFMTGDSQSSINQLIGDPTARDADVPVARVFSPRGQNKTQQFLTLSHDWDERWHAQISFNYGRQKGDGAPDTLLLPTQMGGRFAGASWKGVEARLKYAYSEKLSAAARLEHFEDRDGFALFPNTLVKSDYNALTLGGQWWADKHVLLRPELRYDWQSNNNGVKAYNNGLSDRQTSFNLDVVFYF